MPMFEILTHISEFFENLCVTDNCCYCLSLRAGARTAVAISSVIVIFMLLLSVYEIWYGVQGFIQNSSKADPYNYAIHAIVAVILLLLSIVFAIGTIFLFISILKNRSILVMIWLVLSMMYIVSVFVVSALILDSNPHWVEWIVYFLILAAVVYMFYIWVVVLNFYRTARDVEVAEEAWKEDLTDPGCNFSMVDETSFQQESGPANVEPIATSSTLTSDT